MIKIDKRYRFLLTNRRAIAIIVSPRGRTGVSGGRSCLTQGRGMGRSRSGYSRGGGRGWRRRLGRLLTLRWSSLCASLLGNHSVTNDVRSVVEISMFAEPGGLLASAHVPRLMLDTGCLSPGFPMRWTLSNDGLRFKRSRRMLHSFFIFPGLSGNFCLPVKRRLLRRDWSSR